MNSEDGLPATDGSAHRQFQVKKDNGEFWNMNYTSAGVNWERANGPFDEPTQFQGARAPVGGPLNSLQAVGSVADAAASIGMWWEVRQQRLLSEAVSEETRRGAWLAEMVARWGDAHHAGDRLDLRVSEYLAREAREMLDAIVANKRIALPQSLLYELEIIQESLRAFRSQLLTQFEAISDDSRIDLNSVVGRALPNRYLDMNFIRFLGNDPLTEWAGRVRAKTTGDFDRELTEALRPDVFLSRVFPRKELGASELPDVEKQQNVLDFLRGLMAPALPQLLAVDAKPDASERRDAFRELSLLPAEVSRVKALNSAWLATSEIVSQNSGGESELQVQVSARGLGVVLASTQSNLELASPPNRVEK